MPGTFPAMYKSRPPVINPFDKLTQNQFDSYVSSIQAKIQVALNPPSPEPQPVSRTLAEISHSTIASPAPSPAPLSKHPSQEAHTLPKLARSPLGAGTPNEPFELSDDDEEADQLAPDAQSAASQSDSEIEADAEAEPLSAIPENPEEEGEVQTDEADYSGYEDENGNGPDDEGDWGYSGEDASDDDDLSGAEEAEEEEDVFVGKGKGRHPAEGPGLAALLNSSSASTHRAGGSAQSPERAGHSLRTLEDSFDEGVGRMPVMGVTSTPFVSRLAARRSRSPHTDSGEDDDDAASPPWEVDPGLSMPPVAVYEGGVESDDDEASSQEDTGLGAGHDTAIEVLDSDEENEADKDTGGIEVDEIAPSPTNTEGLHGEVQEPDDIYDGVGGRMEHQEFDELQFDDSEAFPHQGHEPDSLLDDTVDPDNSADLSIKADTILPAPDSLFSGSSAFATREPSQSRDADELDQSADTVQAPERSVEDPANPVETHIAVDVEPELEHSPIQQSMDYSDFIGEHSLLNNSLTHTQAEEHFLEVTVYELENGSRYYDYDGTRHFINTEGQVYETCPIPPPRPTIQRPPDLSMVEEVSEYDMTRKMGDDDDEPGRFNFLQDYDNTFSSAGEPVLGYPEEGDSFAPGMDDIPQRPGAALGFRARDAPGEGASAFLSESAVIGDDGSEVGEQYRILNRLRAEDSTTSTIENPMNGRRAGDLISEADDIVSASEPEGEGDGDGDSQDSILDDEDESAILDRSGLSALANREDLATPVPSPVRDQINEGEINEGDINEGEPEVELQLDEKGVADALAAVAELAKTVSFEELMNGSEPQDPSVTAFAEAMFDDLGQGSPNLENLMNEVSNMSAAEEDILARSFNMVDALQNTSAPLEDFRGLEDLAVPNGIDSETIVESSVPAEINLDAQAAPVVIEAPEKLASEVLTEVFEGLDDNSEVGTGTATPTDPITRVPQLNAHIEDVEERSRSSTPVPSHPLAAESQNPSPRRTPPTPTLSTGQSLTAPELSIATSISEGSAMQPNVSVYEGSPTPSTHREDLLPPVPPADSDPAQLPDPNLPPAPTHLSTPAAPSIAPDASEARRDVSPSVMVEPPTPHTRSEDGTADSAPRELVPLQEAEPDVGLEEQVASEESKPVEGADRELVEEAAREPAKGADQDEEVDVIGTSSNGSNTPKRESRSGSQPGSKQPSEPRGTPTPEDQTRAGDKRKRLSEDAPSPSPSERTPSKSSVKSPNRSNGLVRSPLSESAPFPATPTSRRYQTLFKRTPSIKPLSTASESSSRKTSGSDRGSRLSPAPWPMSHRTHHHASAARNPSVTSPARKITSSNSSPITRSNCRFHKITIPMDDDEDSVKVEFIVPGCALGNHEVLKEQHIEDYGPSTTEEESAMVTDLSNLEPRITNKLTILIGTSLYNENVCGYLEKPSVPKVSRPVPTRSKSLRGSGSWRKSTAEIKAELSADDKEGNKTTSPPPKPKPRSRPSILHDDHPYKPPDDEIELEGSTEAEPTRKRSKKRSTLGGTSSVKFPSLGQDSPQKPASVLSSQPVENRVRISKRMKRARKPIDAQAFKPEPTQGDSSPDEGTERSPRKRPKREASVALSRTDSSAPSQPYEVLEDEENNPFRPKFELKRMLSPEAREQEQQSVFAATSNTEPTAAEQKELEQHVALGDHPGEVVDEEGDYVDVEKLGDPSPAKAAAYVDRDAPSDIGKQESNSAGENALGAKNVGKKGWSNFFRF